MNTNIFKKQMGIVVVTLLIGISIYPTINAATSNTDLQTITSDDIIITVKQMQDHTQITYHIQDYSMKEEYIDGQPYTKIILGEESLYLEKGKPALPNVRRSIVIPDTSKMAATVVSSSYTEIKQINMLPSKGDLPRTVNPAQIPYEFHTMYTEDIWYPENLVVLDEPYILRDIRGQVVCFNPFQYNPAQQKLRVYTDVTIEVYPQGEDTVNCIYRTELPRTVDSDFKNIYQRHFINYNLDNRYDPVSEQGNMLVITYDSFWDSMVPFVQWKNQKGILTEMVNVSEIGNANDIKIYIADYYNDNGLTFVLLVGDADQVPSLYTSPYTYGASDPSYSYIVGSDNYQDLFVGRFSAENPDEVNTQVERSIEYERDPQTGAEWYHKGAGIASNQGPGDDGEYDDEHMDFIRDDLLAYTYTEVDQIYDPYATSTMVSTALNDGRSIVNYCGHGSVTSWGSSGFSNTNVNALTNDNMLPFICSVACNNGEFDDYTCFAEAWLRATNNGEPTGAIGFFASTQSQSWDPPMDAEDEIVDILIETYEDNMRNSYGALCFEGTMHMMDEYGSTCYDETDAWTVFGDPSLQVRSDTPTTISASHLNNIDEGATTFEVTVNDANNAHCALSQNYRLLGYGYTDSTNTVTIELFEPLEGDDPVDLVITAKNKIPYTATIEVYTNIPPEIPMAPEGPPKGKPGLQYLYSSSTTDADGHRILYNFSWGDGTYSGWVGPFDSGTTATATHIWEEEGTFEIRVKAKDTAGGETDWSDPLSISMPKSIFAFSWLFEIIQRLIERFPILSLLF